MSEERNNQQMIMYLLGGVAVLLVAVIVVLVVQNRNASTPQPTQVLQQQQQAQGGATNPGGTVPNVPFDPKTATKVPAGVKPEEVVQKYYDDVKAGKYEEAYNLLPKDKQAYYGSSQSYAQTLQGYGITGVSVEKPQVAGDTITVVGTQQTPQMAISYRWTIEKVSGTWYVKSRESAQ